MRKLYIIGAVFAAGVIGWGGLSYVESGLSKKVDQQIQSSFLKDHIEYEKVSVGALSRSLTLKQVRATSEYARFVNLSKIDELRVSLVELHEGVPVEAHIRASGVSFGPNALSLLGFSSAERHTLQASTGEETFSGTFELHHSFDEEEGLLHFETEIRVDDIAVIAAESDLKGIDSGLQGGVAGVLTGAGDEASAGVTLGQLFALGLLLEQQLNSLQLSRGEISLEDLGAFRVLGEIAAYERQLYGEEKVPYGAPALENVSVQQLIQNYRRPGGKLTIELNREISLRASYQKPVSRFIEDGNMSVSGL